MTYQTLQKRRMQAKQNDIGVLEFAANRSTDQAKKIVVLNHNIMIDLWYNKHYFERYYVGDKNGERRGIDPILIESLVARSMEHLFLYGTSVKNFTFLSPNDRSKFPNRVVLQEMKIGSTLNVVIEVHQITGSRFEVTVVTAMVTDEFKIASGQYCIKVQQDRTSLRKVDDGKLVEICSYKLAPKMD